MFLVALFQPGASGTVMDGVQDDHGCTTGTMFFLSPVVLLHPAGDVLT